jgi:hypothetical protein
MNMVRSDLLSIIVAPGATSYRYINGRQVPLFTLVAIFFITNLVFFAGHDRSDLYAQMNNMPYSGVAKEIVQNKVRKNKTSQKKFEAVYETRSWLMSKVLLIVTVFYFSIVLYIINYRKTLKYIDHLAVSFEFMALATLYVLTILSWIPSLIVSLIATAVLLYAFERNAYKQRPLRSTANAALLVFGFYAVLLAYRASVFFLTLLTL